MHDYRDEAQGSASVTGGQEPVGTGGVRVKQEPEPNYLPSPLFVILRHHPVRTAKKPGFPML